MTGSSNKLNWTTFGWINASRDAATLAVFLRFPPRSFQVSDCPPATLIFTTALMSRLWKVPQKRYSHSRIFNAFFPQQEHRWLVDSHGEIIRKSRPYLSDFADSISRKERPPKSDMAGDSWRFLTIPDAFESSNTKSVFKSVINSQVMNCFSPHPTSPSPHYPKPEGKDALWSPS